MLARDRAIVTHHRRDGDGWHTRVHRDLGAEVVLPGPGVTLALREVYERVDVG